MHLPNYCDSSFLVTLDLTAAFSQSHIQDTDFNDDFSKYFPFAGRPCCLEILRKFGQSDAGCTLHSAI